MFTTCHVYDTHAGMLSHSSDEPKRTVKYVLDVGSIAAQLIGFFIWPLTITSASSDIWYIPVSIALVSCHWWENFVSRSSPLGAMIARQAFVEL